MTKDDRIASFKYSVLQHARKHNNITYTCKVFNLSRTVYYKWIKRFSKIGYLGLQDKEKAKPQMPNQIKPDKEKIILNYIIDYPTHGPRNKNLTFSKLCILSKCEFFPTELCPKSVIMLLSFPKIATDNSGSIERTLSGCFQ